MEGASGATDGHMASVTPVNFLCSGSDCGKSTGILQHGKHIVTEGIVKWCGVALESGDGGGFSEDMDDEIHDMAAKFKHDATGVLSEFESISGGNDLADDGLNIEDLSEPAMIQNAAKQCDARVIAIHVAHLQEQIFLCGGGEDCGELRE